MEEQAEVKLFGKWSYEDLEVKDIALIDYIGISGKQATFLPHTQVTSRSMIQLVWMWFGTCGETLGCGASSRSTRAKRILAAWPASLAASMFISLSRRTFG
eukprot:scaffold442_cov268-Pinguiococcus_pyrenoidosus.AAC.54